MNAANANLSSPTRAYVEARQTLHQQIQGQHLLGHAAWQSDDQVTLRSDLTCGDLTFKAGSSYSLNPYAHKHTSESLNYTQNKTGATVVIQHEFSKSTFKAQEKLGVETHGDAQLGLSSFSMDDSSAGWHPQGWVQRELDRNHVDGFILKM